MSDDNSILDFYSRQLTMIEATAGGVVIGDRRVVKMPGDGEPSYLLFKNPDPMRIAMPMSMEMPKPDPIDFVIGRNLGGYAVRPDPMRIVTVVSIPMPRAPGVDAMLADGWVWTDWRFARDQVPRPEPGPRIHAWVESWERGASVFVRTGPAGDESIGSFSACDMGGNAVEAPHLEWVVAGALVWVREIDGGTGRTRDPGRYAAHITDRPVLAGRYADRLPTNRRRKRERAKVRRRARLAR